MRKQNGENFHGLFERRNTLKLEISERLPNTNIAREKNVTVY